MRPHLYRLGLVTTAYWALNLLCLGVIAIAWRGAGLSTVEAFPTACPGMVLGFAVLLPVHEHAHALAYRAVGARGVHVRYHPRRLTAACVAPAAVLTAAEFAVVSLAPLTLINPAPAATLALLPAGKSALMLAGALWMHVGACSGDVAFVQYLWSRRSTRLLTYDDPARPITFFCRPRPQD